MIRNENQDGLSGGNKDAERAEKFTHHCKPLSDLALRKRTASNFSVKAQSFLSAEEPEVFRFVF